MQMPAAPDFAHPDLQQQLRVLDDDGLDRLDFGVTAFDKASDARVQRCNLVEQRGAGLDRSR